MITAIVFFVSYCVCCLLAVFRHPIYGLVMYVGLVYIHPPSQWWSQLIPSLRWSLVVAAITLFGVIVRRSNASGPRLFGFGFMWGLVLLVAWAGVQMLWSLDPPMHTELFVLLVKYTVLVALVYLCIDSITHLKMFLWAHAAGCFYLGTVVIAQYLGGRFEGFRGPGIDEANAAGLLIVTGIITTFVLFLSGKLKEKAVAVGFMPFTLNALVATISRSGFLALVVSGILFNLFAPKRMIGAVRIFSISGLVLLMMVTNASYWERIGTILFAGEQVEGVDTGSGRLVLMQAQLEMFSDHPLGCGHRCTAVLSPAYLEDRYLTGAQGNRQRSSHNTFLTLLVEQGVPGVVLYVLLLIWIARTTFRLRGKMRRSNGLVPVVYAATVSVLGAITVGDLFVDYLKFEARFWFIGLLMVVVKMGVSEEQTEVPQTEKFAGERA